MSRPALSHCEIYNLLLRLSESESFLFDKSVDQHYLWREAYIEPVFYVDDDAGGQHPSDKYYVNKHGKEFIRDYESDVQERKSVAKKEKRDARKSNLAIIISICALLINVLSNLEKIAQSIQYLIELLR